MATIKPPGTSAPTLVPNSQSVDVKSDISSGAQKSPGGVTTPSDQFDGTKSSSAKASTRTARPDAPPETRTKPAQDSQRVAVAPSATSIDLEGLQALRHDMTWKRPGISVSPPRPRLYCSDLWMPSKSRSSEKLKHCRHWLHGKL